MTTVTPIAQRMGSLQLTLNTQSLLLKATPRYLLCYNNHMKKTNHPRYERTLVILKPDAVQRGLIGEIIRRYERVGLKLAAMKMIVATPEMIHKHYMLDPEWMLK